MYSDTVLGAKSRRGLSHLEQLAGEETPGGLVDRVRGLPKGESMTIQVSEAISLELEMVSPDRGAYSQRALFTDGLSEEEKQQAAEELLDSLAERAQGFNQDMQGISEKLAAGEAAAYGDQEYSFDGQGDDVQAFLDGTSLRGIGYDMFGSSDRRYSVVRERAKTVETIYKELPMRYPAESEKTGGQEGVYVDGSGNITKVLLPTHKPGVYLGMLTSAGQRGDLSELQFRLGVEVADEETYAEQSYNGMTHESVAPFIETQSAQQIMTQLESAGLSLNERLRDSFAEVGSIEKRYGHGYADITREIAKLVNDPERPLDSFFETEDDQSTLQKLAQMELPDEQAANTALALLKGLAEARLGQGDGSEGVPELQSSTQRINMKDGSCKDIEVYIADGGPVQPEDGTEPVFWRSTYSRPGVMTLKPVKLNGVVLPTGSLLATEDDGYLFMRVTSFAFDRETAQQVFGAQNYENEQNSPSYLRKAERIRELTLQ